MRNSSSNSFHITSDATYYIAAGSAQGTKVRAESPRVSMTEWELNYRFYSHFHPYIADLIRKLIERSVQGLQDADTQLLKPNQTLPGSVQVALDPGTNVTILGGRRVAFPNPVQASTANGESITLESGQNQSILRVMLKNDTPVTLNKGAQVTLLDGTEVSGVSSTKLKLAENRASFLYNTSASLADTTRIVLPSGTEANVHKGTLITLLNNDQAIIPKDTSATLLDRRPTPKLYEEFFEAGYGPSDLVQRPYPVKDLDFTTSGAYSAYNWELFFHIPLTIAIHLSKNQRFEEAQHWFHFLFDPTDDSDGPTPERFWKVKPFQYTNVKKLEEILVNLATGADPQLQKDTVNSINKWAAAPFRPHAVARFRHSAYMLKTVMAYLDNLIAWGDMLFRQDTGESINEATQLYILAANILGPRPQNVPTKGSVGTQTYNTLKKHLKEFGSVEVAVQANIPFDLIPTPNTTNDARAVMLGSLGKSLYFCVPRNDRLLRYWDTVADRLFKIHNSLNIQGIFRQLPLYEAPIDPALLARAAAAGVDVGSIVNGLNQPLPLVRFQLLAQKAAEICQEVKSLGNNLLSAMEKEDNEALAILRAKHERVILGLAESVKYAQWQESIKTREGLEKSLVNAVLRYTYYERLLGREQSEIKIPELEALDASGLEKMKFKASEPEVGPREIMVDIAQGAEGISGGKLISSHEMEELNKLAAAQSAQEAAIALDTIAAVLNLIPAIGIDVKPIGLGAGIEIGGEDIAALLSTIANVSRAVAGRDSYEANRAAKIGSYARREQDWAFQSNLAGGEITQTFKQLRAAQIRESIAEREWKNHQQQIKHSEEIERYLTDEKTGKKTSQAFYAWMKREVKGLYSQCFQFAFEIAKKAERALQHELGNPDLSYIQFGYLTGKEGLLAGEKLYMDIKRMDLAYHELNQREYELTKHVSLMQVDPLALLQLRTTGRCTLRLPEPLFDMDGPAYFRRIKSVALSIPCVAGPYASVNCKLTMLKSSIRKTPVVGDQYARIDAEDDRFSDYYGSLQSIVTSSAQNDSGMFETNLRDERYLPFEGSGVISEWQLELPANPSNKDPRQFDYDTISDVILHIRYTAREGGELLRQGAMQNLGALIESAQAAGSMRLFSVRHEFPTEWAKLKNGTGTVQLTLKIGQEHFPFWSKDRLETVKQVDLFMKNASGNVMSITPVSNSGVDIITHNTDGTETISGPITLANLSLAKLPNKFTLKFRLLFNDKSMNNLWLALTWGKGA
jgi:hypothetical protein